MADERVILENAIDSAHSPLVLSDPHQDDNPLVYVNEAFEDFTGYDKSEILGSNCRFLQGEETDPETVAQVREAVEKEESVTVEIRNYRKDGTMFWNKLSITPVYDEENSLVRFLGTQTDITNRKEYEQQLEELNTRLQLALEETNTGIWEWDLDTDEVIWDETSEQLFGYDRGEFPDTFAGFADRVPDDDLEQVHEQADHAIETGEQYRAEFRAHPPTGDQRWIQSRGVVQYDDDENPTRMIGVQTDITERKEYEQQLKEQRDNLKLLNRVVRHDIRNNLQIIRGHTGMLEEHVDESGQEHINTIDENTMSAIELTKTARELNETMLSTEADVEPIRLDHHLDPVITNARSDFDDAIITVENPIPNSVVSGNELLKSIFRNLIQNAVVHNDKETPQIQLSVTVADETLTVAVADNGPGIPDNQKEEIFGKGEKGLDSPGTGIGLYLVQTLVDQYGGDIWVEDNKPEGSVFVVELPISDAEQG